jgi:mannose-1-phosphate guanylyltransferase
MNAVVLVGGEGTRMRPLTETIPKPLIPLVDRPFLDHVLDHLARHEVREAILSSPYLEGMFAGFLQQRTGRLGVKWISESAPLGTAGAIRNAAAEIDGAFLALNGDILTDLDFTELISAHRTTGATASIALTEVADARAYGLVDVDGAGRVREFREKPPERGPGLVNAGIYVLEPRAIAGVPGDRPVSIEREVFPDLIARGERVQGHVSRAYWRDLGTPEAYLRATFDVLEGRVEGLAYVSPHQDASAHVSLMARLGRWVVVGPGATVGERAEIEDTVMLAGSSVGRDAKVRGSILGPRTIVGDGAIVEDAVLAERSSVPAGARSRGARLRPYRSLDA